MSLLFFILFRLYSIIFSFLQVFVTFFLSTTYSFLCYSLLFCNIFVNVYFLMSSKFSITIDLCCVWSFLLIPPVFFQLDRSFVSLWIFRFDYKGCIRLLCNEISSTVGCNSGICRSIASLSS